MTEIKLTEEEINSRKYVAKEFIRKYQGFWVDLSKKFDRQENKRMLKPFHEIIKAFLFDTDLKSLEISIKKDMIIFGNLSRDGWQYYYNWQTTGFGSFSQRPLTPEEIQARNEKAKKNRLKLEERKYKEWDINPKDIGNNYQFKASNKSDADFLYQVIRFEGIDVYSRNYPIRFHSYADNTNKQMSLDLFIDHYYKPKGKKAKCVKVETAQTT